MWSNEIVRGMYDVGALTRKDWEIEFSVEDTGEYKFLTSGADNIFLCILPMTV